MSRAVRRYSGGVAYTVWFMRSTQHVLRCLGYMGDVPADPCAGQIVSPSCCIILHFAPDPP